MKTEGTQGRPITRELESFAKERRRSPGDDSDDSERARQCVQGLERAGQRSGSEEVDGQRGDRAVEVTADPGRGRDFGK